MNTLPVTVAQTLNAGETCYVRKAGAIYDAAAAAVTMNGGRLTVLGDVLSSSGSAVVVASGALAQIVVGQDGDLISANDANNAAAPCSATGSRSTMRA